MPPPARGCSAAKGGWGRIRERSHRMSSRKAHLLGAVAIVVLASAAFAGSTNGPTPYLSFNDSPLKGVDFSGGYFHLEDFEDLLLNTPGVTASAGDPFGPGGFTDSVDADDGT